MERVAFMKLLLSCNYCKHCSIAEGPASGVLGCVRFTRSDVQGNVPWRGLWATIIPTPTVKLGCDVWVLGLENGSHCTSISPVRDRAQ
jgi:hypothetical protein